MSSKLRKTKFYSVRELSKIFKRTPELITKFINHNKINLFFEKRTMKIKGSDALKYIK